MKKRRMPYGLFCARSIDVSKNGGNYQVKFELEEDDDIELAIYIEGENGEKEERIKFYPTNEWVDLGY